MIRLALLLLFGLVALAIPGSATAARQPAPPRVVGSSTLSAVVAGLRVSPQAPELKASPALVGRLRDTPRGYFRFVTRRFTQAVCAQFHDARGGFPDVNLHGDAHLEQYAVTSLGRGLTDFDESARGPSFIDLVRFGVSLELAAREKDWPGEGRRAFGAFLGGYREALKNPDINSPAPLVVTHARGAFARDHRLALRRADAMIDADPVPASEIEADSRDYVTQMLADWAGMPASSSVSRRRGVHAGNRQCARREVPLPHRGLEQGGQRRSNPRSQARSPALGRRLRPHQSGPRARAARHGPHRLRSLPVLGTPHPPRPHVLGPRLDRRLHGAVDRFVVRLAPGHAAGRLQRGDPVGGAHPKEVAGKDFRPVSEGSCFRPRARTRVGSARPSTIWPRPRSQPGWHSAKQRRRSGVRRPCNHTRTIKKT